MEKLPSEYYLNADVTAIAKDLLGKWIFTQTPEGHITGGMIVETEAYGGVTDRASHAYNGKRTARTEVMYQQGGLSYVYLCYGMHHLFNVITHNEGTPHAVLIRAIQPLIGIDIMLQRRGLSALSYKLSAGPALLTQALAIDRKFNGVSLTGNQIWIADDSTQICPSQIVATSRVGVAYAKEDASLPWRFHIKENAWVSGSKSANTVK